MEVKEIRNEESEFPRILNNISQQVDEGYPGDGKHRVAGTIRGGRDNRSVARGVVAGRLFGWPSSRIVRVSRSSGGKDRHSKVWTSKGLRDRRVRLSVNTAIQLFDLQDRLGHDQPSKAIEWLLKAASTSIEELPPISTPFFVVPKQTVDEKMLTEQEFDSAHDADLDGDTSQPQQLVSLSRSTCSSNSETSKGSGLSLSRSENRTKARERARERTVEKERKKENGCQVSNHQNVNIAQTSTFTELLTGGLNSLSDNVTISNTKSTGNQNSVSGGSNEVTYSLQKSSRDWNSTPLMDYNAAGLLLPPSTSSSSMFLGNNSLPQAMMLQLPPFNVTGEHHLQHYSFVPERVIQMAASTGGAAESNHSDADYSPNFTIPSSSSSSGLAGLNRGTLQSNSASFLSHLQRFPSIDRSSNFFIWATAPGAAANQEGKGKY